MAIRYKIDVLNALKEAGYSTYKLRKEKILGESTLQAFRRGEIVSWENIDRLCALLQCQPGDLVEYEEVKPDAWNNAGARKHVKVKSYEKSKNFLFLLAFITYKLYNRGE